MCIRDSVNFVPECSIGRISKSTLSVQKWDFTSADYWLDLETAPKYVNFVSECSIGRISKNTLYSSGTLQVPIIGWIGKPPPYMLILSQLVRLEETQRAHCTVVGLYKCRFLVGLGNRHPFHFLSSAHCHQLSTTALISCHNKKTVFFQQCEKCDEKSPRRDVLS